MTPFMFYLYSLLGLAACFPLGKTSFYSGGTSKTPGTFLRVPHNRYEFVHLFRFLKTIYTKIHYTFAYFRLIAKHYFDISLNAPFLF